MSCSCLLRSLSLIWSSRQKHISLLSSPTLYSRKCCLHRFRFLAARKETLTILFESLLKKVDFVVAKLFLVSSSLKEEGSTQKESSLQKVTSFKFHHHPLVFLFAASLPIFQELTLTHNFSLVSLIRFSFWEVQVFLHPSFTSLLHQFLCKSFCISFSLQRKNLLPKGLPCMTLNMMLIHCLNAHASSICFFSCNNTSCSVFVTSTLRYCFARNSCNANICC